MPGWWKWQTHYLEVVAPARVWEFESPPGHFRFVRGHLPPHQFWAFSSVGYLPATAFLILFNEY